LHGGKRSLVGGIKAVPLCQQADKQSGVRTQAGDMPFFLIAGPCVIESRDHVLFMADALKKMGYTNPVSMDGGWRGWNEQGFPTEK